MTAVEVLHRLQEADSALDTDRERLIAVEAELSDRGELRAARKALTERTAALHKAEGDQRDLELQVETLRGQLDAAEKKLYGGRVGDARELTNLTRDATQYRTRIGALEDRLLELFEATDGAGAEQARVTAHLRQVEHARAVRELELTTEKAALLESIQAGEATRAALREEAEVGPLRTYDHLRKARGGLAVAELRQRTCQGCRISLPAGEEQRVRQGALIQCQSCTRILYAAP